MEAGEQAGDGVIAVEQSDRDALRHTIPVERQFSLAITCGPVAWVGARSPRHAWHAGVLTWVGWEGDRIVWRKIRQPGPGKIDITGSASPERSPEWGSAVLGLDITMPNFRDSLIDDLANRFLGLHPYCDGSLFDGILTAIVGQSISVTAAAVTQARLAACYAEPIELDGRPFRPLPTANHLADSSVELIRTSGVTWKRAEGIRHAARELIAGALPTDEDARVNPEEAVKALVTLPLIGRWTAESAVLWGIGAPDAHPTGDIALLRAARQAYGREEMTLKDLDRFAEGWRPGRGLAARLLWTSLFGPAPKA